MPWILPGFSFMTETSRLIDFLCSCVHTSLLTYVQQYSVPVCFSHTNLLQYISAMICSSCTFQTMHAMLCALPFASNHTPTSFPVFSPSQALTAPTANTSTIRQIRTPRTIPRRHPRPHRSRRSLLVSIPSILLPLLLRLFHHTPMPTP